MSSDDVVIAEGKYHKNISILIGHAFADGLIFTPPWIRNNAALRKHAQTLYPTINSTALDKVDELYPFVSVVPRDLVALASDFLDDVSVSCNNVYLQEPTLRTGDAPVYRYLFGPPPAPIHGLIPFYVFYNGEGSANTQADEIKFPSPDPKLAKYIQSSFVNFIRSGNPNPNGAKEPWTRYEAGDFDTARKVMRFGDFLGNTTDYSISKDEMFRPVRAERCPFWQTVPYYNSPDDEFVNQRPGQQWEL